MTASRAEGPMGPSGLRHAKNGAVHVQMQAHLTNVHMHTDDVDIICDFIPVSLASTQVMLS